MLDVFFTFLNISNFFFRGAPDSISLHMGTIVRLAPLRTNVITFHAPGGSIGKVVASYAKVCRVNSRDTAHAGGGTRPVNWIYRL